MISSHTGSDSDSAVLGLYHYDTLLVASIFCTGWCNCYLEESWLICGFICSNPARALSLEALGLGFTGLIMYLFAFLAGLPHGRT